MKVSFCGALTSAVAVPDSAIAVPLRGRGVRASISIAMNARIIRYGWVDDLLLAGITR
jgi:hypothetical protein